MSDIIEDADGYHIIRVIEREDAGFTPLAEVQDQIKAKLQREKIAQAQQQLIADLAKAVPVWSIFPDDLPGAIPLRIATTGPKLR